MKLDKVGEDFIKKQEGFSLTAYRDVKGVWTIGWGFTINQDTGHAVKQGDVITQEKAEQWFQKSITNYENTVNTSLRVIINISKLTQNMFNACVSLCYNIGQEAFKNSTLVKYIINTANISPITIQNQLTYSSVMQFVKSGIAYWFLVWHLDNGDVIPDLVSRRKLEIKLYFS